MITRITSFDATILRFLFGCCMIPTVQLGHFLFGFAVLEFSFSDDYSPGMVVAVVFFFNLGMV